MATNINNKLVCNEPHANLDSYYGPYDSVHAAYLALADTTVNGVNYTKKYIGLTVGVWNSAHTEVTEYWFKGGLNESNLVEKTSGGGLPGNVKIVTFDKNGGSGVQNSILTDTDGQIVLPECTFTKTGETFSCWAYNDTQKNPGEYIKIGTTTVVQAVWGSSKPNHKITWSAGTGVSSITGTVNGVGISSGDSVKEDSTIVLTATTNSDYNFSQWSGLPSGTSSNNPVTFTMGTSDISVTATASKIALNYKIEFEKGEGIGELLCYADGEEIETGSERPEGTPVVLEAEPEEDYSITWDGCPEEYETLEDGRILKFLLKDNVYIIAKGENKPVSDKFSYYGCNQDMKWFEFVDDLQVVDGSSVEIEENNYNYLYVICNSNINPMISVEGREETYSFIPLNKCEEDPDIIEHFEQKSWVEPNTNQTKDTLKDYGNYIYIYIDKEEALKDVNIIISIGE